MVLDLLSDDMAGCQNEQDLPECDCDVNRQDNSWNLSSMQIFFVHCRLVVMVSLASTDSMFINTIRTGCNCISLYLRAVLKLSE